MKINNPALASFYAAFDPARFCSSLNEPSVDLDSSSLACVACSRASMAGVITVSASLPAANSFGGFFIPAILTRASPSFAGSPGCLP